MKEIERKEVELQEKAKGKGKMLELEPAEAFTKKSKHQLLRLNNDESNTECQDTLLEPPIQVYLVSAPSRKKTTRSQFANPVPPPKARHTPVEKKITKKKKVETMPESLDPHLKKLRRYMRKTAQQPYSLGEFKYTPIYLYPEFEDKWQPRVDRSMMKERNLDVEQFNTKC